MVLKKWEQLANLKKYVYRRGLQVISTLDYPKDVATNSRLGIQVQIGTFFVL